MQKGLKKLFLQLFLLALPLLCILLSFFVFDPYGFFLPLEEKPNSLIPISDDYIAVERFLKYNPEKNYNSFTFGNSKTLAYLSSDWCAHITTCSAFKFGVPGECIYNIYNKLKLIDKQGNHIDNVLLIFDNKLFVNYKNTQKFFQGPAYLHHPYSKDGSWMEFYTDYLKFYFSDFAFLKVAEYKLTNKYTPAMTAFFKNPSEMDDINKGIQFFPFTNEVINTDAEKELESDSSSYYEKNKSKFASRKLLQKENRPWEIHPEDLINMQEMFALFKKHHTNFKIILGPNFDQIPFPTKQKNELSSIFGSENIYDFTGENSYTNAVSNYYEQSHYRTKVGKSILEKIYFKQN
jgi:hypothetical protein